MTVIAGFAGSNGAAIASDSQATLGDTPLNMGSKVINAGSFLVGIAGFAATLEVVRKKISNWSGPLNTKDDVAKFADWIKQQNIDLGMPADQADGFGFVLVTKDAAWSGAGTVIVLPGKNGIAVCGSGGTHAMTAMKLLYKRDGGVQYPEDFVREAVGAAIEQSITCGGDIFSEAL